MLLVCLFGCLFACCLFVVCCMLIGRSLDVCVLLVDCGLLYVVWLIVFVLVVCCWVFVLVVWLYDLCGLLLADFCMLFYGMFVVCCVSSGFLFGCCLFVVLFWMVVLLFVDCIVVDVVCVWFGWLPFLFVCCLFC